MHSGDFPSSVFWCKGQDKSVSSCAVCNAAIAMLHPTLSVNSDVQMSEDCEVSGDLTCRFHGCSTTICGAPHPQPRSRKFPRKSFYFNANLRNGNAVLANAIKRNQSELLCSCCTFLQMQHTTTTSRPNASILYLLITRRAGQPMCSRSRVGLLYIEDRRTVHSRSRL